MNQELINQMTEIVESKMESFKTDFYNYDKTTVQNAPKFPLIWIVGKSHTHLLEVGDFDRMFNENEWERYAYIRGEMPWAVYTYPGVCSGDDFYLITEDGISLITQKQAKEVVRDMVYPVVEKWKEEHGELPKYRPVDVKLHGITLGKLKSLVKECREHGDDSLMKCLKSKRFARRSANHVVDVYYAPQHNEFFFQEICNGNNGLCGGIVFHGWPESGYEQNFSVQLTPSYGWSSHT